MSRTRRVPRDKIGARGYRALYQQCPDGVLFTVPDGEVIAANPAACEILRLPEEEICRRGRAGLADHSDPRWPVLVAERDRTGRALGVARMVRGDGLVIEVEMNARVFTEGGQKRTCTVIRDVTERVATERQVTRMAAELRDLAVLDDLTGLGNRRGFLGLAGQVLEVADRQLLPCQMLFLDVDNMKAINDTFGHSAGDIALQAVAATLRQAMRRADVLGRMGGDEFVALIVGLDDDERAGIERRIRVALASRRIAKAVGTGVEVSLGWAAHRAGEGSTVTDLLIEADRVMYNDKRLRRSRAAGSSASPSPVHSAWNRS